MTGRRRLPVACALTLIAAGAAPAARADDAGLPALYATTQAQHGKSIYASKCASCHGKALVGGGAPALTGMQFFTREMHNKLGAVFQYMAREMPGGRPGSLTHEQYADLMAFILQQNGFPAGDTPLTYEAALTSDAILYDAKH